MALLAVLAFGVWGAFAVFAAAGTAAPTLTSTPANPGAATATFGYSESAANATFACTLDGAVKTCAGTSGSGKTTGSVTFSSLAGGSHTFSITATVSGKTSSATSFTWTVDTLPPTIALSFPTNGSFVNSAGWAIGCSGGAGICGTASDATGVASVKVSVLQQSSNKYWNGSSFASPSEGYTVATGTTSWRLPLALPAAGFYTVHVTATDTLGNTSASPLIGSFTVDTTAPQAPSITSGPSGTVASNSAAFQFSSLDTGPGTDTFLCKLDAGSYAACVSGVQYPGLSDGSHTFSVEAKDAAGNISATAATRTWSVDTTGPPKPTVLGPNNNNPSTAATFTFSDSETTATFKCQIDGGGYTLCTSPKTYTVLPAGTHVFDVEPLDQLSNVGPFNEWKWTISGNSGAGQPFGINTSPSATLYPGGATDYLDLSLSNPNSVTIYITSLTFGLTVTPHHTGPIACSAIDDFTRVQYSGGYPIVLPPGTKTLSQLGYSQAQMPSITMNDRHDTHPGDGNQNACIGADLTFTYTGSAQS